MQANKRHYGIFFDEGDVAFHVAHLEWRERCNKARREISENFARK
jgi:hypothetical protein